MQRTTDLRSPPLSKNIDDHEEEEEDEDEFGIDRNEEMKGENYERALDTKASDRISDI